MSGKLPESRGFPITIEVNLIENRFILKLQYFRQVTRPPITRGYWRYCKLPEILVVGYPFYTDFPSAKPW